MFSYKILPLFNYITKAWWIQPFTANTIDVTECYSVLVFVVLSDLTIRSSSCLRPALCFWAACSFSSLLGCSEWMSSLPRSQSLPVWIFCSLHLSHAGLPSAHFLRAHVSLQLVPMGHCAIWQADCGTKAEITIVCSFSLGILSLCYSGSSGKNGSQFIWFAAWFSSVASVSESSMRDLSPISKSDGWSLVSLFRDG